MRIALLEDDPDQAAIYRLWLEDVEHTVRGFANGNDFLRAIRRDTFDIYMVDWMLPDISGVDVIEKLRGEFKDYTPVLLATTRGAERDIVRGLEAGADDYLAKPLRQQELLARIGALARRAGGGRGDEEDIDAAPYRIDTKGKRVLLRGEEIALTSREYDLAVFFFRHAGSAASRAHILESIWGIENAQVTTRTVDTHISRLRKKLALNEDNGWRLSAIYQHGYRLERVEASAELATREAN